MRDDRQKWTPLDLHPDREIRGRDVLVRRVVPVRQTLISGERGRALAFAGLATAKGWPEVSGPGPYALSLRRDRILVVDGDEGQTGWLGDLGLAVSDMTTGYAVVDLTGARAMDLLKTGVEVSLGVASPSVVRLWHGFGVLLARYQDADRFRLHVAAAQAEGFWGVMAAQLRVMDGA